MGREMKDIKKQGLLEYFALEAGCMYLSDLHQPQKWIFVDRKMSKALEGQFNADEWNDAVQYFTGQKTTFDDAKTAAEYLKKFLAGEADSEILLK